MTHAMTLTIDEITTPLGTMLAGATPRALVCLTFARSEESAGESAEEEPALEAEAAVEAEAAPDRWLAGLTRRMGVRVVSGENALTRAVETELGEYFEGSRREFTVPIEPRGTPFQLEAWEALRSIPYGETRSYAQQARSIGRDRAVRAVAQANGANALPLIIPCHRVIGADGSLTGYGAGVWRKRRLLDLERSRA